MQERTNQALDAVERLVREALAVDTSRPLVLGICGAQGSGKSTLAAGLKRNMERSGVSTALLSIDDLYLTRRERQALAERVHPLLRTRGAPGTHDIALALEILARLDWGEGALLPRFDKANDDRLPRNRWEKAEPGTRLLILEGWCVGARPQDQVDLMQPVNALEQDEDRQGLWRRHANDSLMGEYQRLFGRIDRLVLLAAPGFDVVARWRMQQEHELRSAAGSAAPGVMSDAEVLRFIQHYERLTRHILAEMPSRADMVIELDENRDVTAVRACCGGSEARHIDTSPRV